MRDLPKREKIFSEDDIISKGGYRNSRDGIFIVFVSNIEKVEGELLKSRRNAVDFSLIIKVRRSIQAHKYLEYASFKHANWKYWRGYKAQSTNLDGVK